jgi:hypothetical protein
MTSFRLVRRVWLCAITAGLAILTGCGGGTSSSHPLTVVNNCSIQVNALRPPCPPGVTCETLSSENWNQFQTIATNPAIHGVNLAVPWNSVETSQQNYDFSSLDQQISYYQANYPNLKVNLMFIGVSYGNVNNPTGGVNTFTPSYVFTSSWAGSLGAAPQDVTYCDIYPGNGTLVDTWANVNTAGFDSTGYPVVYEKPYMTAYQAFIAKVIAHYNGNATIGYMRFGLSVGDETDAYCTPQLQSVPSPNTFAGDPSPSTWENYLSAMVGYEHSQKPTMLLLNSLNALNTTAPNFTVVPDFEAGLAKSNNFGFGSNGLQKSDIQASQDGKTCTSDWCALFDQYAGQVPLELQTSTISDPTDSDPNNPTGSLANLIPVVVQHHATILELSLPDLYIGLDPNYNPTYYGAYNPAISNACSQ